MESILCHPGTNSISHKLILIFDPIRRNKSIKINFITNEEKKIITPFVLDYKHLSCFYFLFKYTPYQINYKHRQFDKLFQLAMLFKMIKFEVVTAKRYRSLRLLLVMLFF